MKHIKIKMLTLVFLGICAFAKAQVGIGTTDPKASLDIPATNPTAPGATEGILIPRVDEHPTGVTAAQDGMLVFVTGNGTPPKGFYYWDNNTTTWILVSGVTAGGGSLDDAYDFGGAGNGNTITATDGAVTIDGRDGLLVTGLFAIGEIITASGPGARMFFNPRKGAFRAGVVNGTEWNDANVGNLSVAFGLATIANGTSSSAFGSNTIASGDQSVAFGLGSIASGDQSTAFGRSASATGTRSLSIGFNATASGLDAIAFGSGSEASQNGAVAIGSGSEASGFDAMALGRLTTASGNNATAFGEDTTASGENSTTFGQGTIASSLYSTALGFNTTASAFAATAFGQSTQASGSRSTAFGFFTTASGERSTAFGDSNRAFSFSETVLGIYSSNYTPSSTAAFDASDRIFAIGNGTSNASRSNALTIYKSGLMNINDEYNMPLVDGTAGQVMMTDGNDNVTFQNLPSFTDTNTQNTLDQAYDEGGAGAGRTINVDNGAVQISGNAGGTTATTPAQLILTETQANDFSRLRFTNSVETTNTWTIATLTDNTNATSRMNFNHTGIGDLFQLWGDGFVEVNGIQEIDGRLGININNPGQALILPNTTDNTLGGTLARAWTTYSDNRVKSNQEIIDNALSTVLQITPKKYFHHNSNFEDNGLQLDDEGEQTVGFIAQELYEVLPEAVKKPENEQTELWSVDYDKVIPIAVKAIQELKAEKDILSLRVQELEAKVDTYAALEARIATLENSKETQKDSSNPIGVSKE